MDALEALELVRRALGANAPPALAVGELWTKYAEWGRRSRKSWASSQAVHWNHLQPAWGTRVVSTITHADVDAYRRERSEDGCAPATRNRELSSLRACLNWALKRRMIPTNPLAGMEQEAEHNARTEFIDEAAFRRLLEAAPNPMARALFIVAMDTGMRRGELVGLQRADVDLDARLLRLGDADVKNGSGRIVPLTDRAVDALRGVPAWSRFMFSFTGRPIGASTINDWFRAARERADLPAKLTFHGLRHSCATLMRRRGVPWPLIKAALGWKTDVAARRYQQYAADDWEQLRERMNAGIVAETRKGPLRAVEKTEPAHTVAKKAQATNEK